MYPTDRYGFDAGAFVVTERRVRRAETVSDILSDAGISHAFIARLAEVSRDTYDLRRIRAGRPFRVYADSLGMPRFFVYEPDRTQYVVARLSEPVSVERVSRPVTLKQRVAEGRIEQSLYETLMAADLDPALAIELSEIFAWDIDFATDLRQGDEFEFLIEELRYEDGRVRYGQILSALFVNGGETYFAAYYETAYLDEMGSSGVPGLT